MSRLLDTVAAFFTGEGWELMAVEGRPELVGNFRGDNGQWEFRVRVREAEAQIGFFSECPVDIPEPHRAAMAEFVNRANWGLYVGNLELEMDSGALRVRTAIDVEGATLTPALMQWLYRANVAIMDRYLPGIFAVIYGGESPRAAIRAIEDE